MEYEEFKTKYPEPFKAYKFLVQIQKGSETPVAAAFARFSGIKISVDVLSGRSGDEKRGTFSKVTGLTRYENITLSQGIVGNTDFLEWITSAASTHDGPPTGKDKKRTVIVSALTEQNHPAIQWELIDCLPVSYVVDPFDASKSAYMSESIELSIEGVKRTLNPPQNSPANG